MPEISVIVPTYNESENIETLIEEVLKVLSGRDFEILVVDDNSPDGTAEIVRSVKNSRLRLFKRKRKKGLGSAYKFGLKKAKGKKIVHIDADFSHDPSSIPELLDNIGEGADVVVGSRYIEEGERKDPIKRRIFPSIGNFLFNNLLGIGAKDVTSGFRAYKKGIIDNIDLSNLPDGFSFQAGFLYEAKERNAAIKEVPIEFKDRERGESKYSRGEILNNIKLLFRLLLKKYFGTRFLKFCIVGMSGVLVNMGILWFFTEFYGLFYVLSGIVAKESSIISNFLLNEHWTWKDKGVEGIFAKLKRLVKYNLVSAGGAMINIGLLAFLTFSIGFHYLISNLIGIGGAVLWNFSVNKRWTWNLESENL